MSPALAGGFLTTVPPGKPPYTFKLLLVGCVLEFRILQVYLDFQPFGAIAKVVGIYAHLSQNNKGSFTEPNWQPLCPVLLHSPASSHSPQTVLGVDSITSHTHTLKPPSVLSRLSLVL